MPSYRVDGDIYDILDEEKQDFLSDFPYAEELQEVYKGQEIYDIPVNDVGQALEDVPEFDTHPEDKEFGMEKLPESAVVYDYTEKEDGTLELKDVTADVKAGRINLEKTPVSKDAFMLKEEEIPERIRNLADTYKPYDIPYLPPIPNLRLALDSAGNALINFLDTSAKGAIGLAYMAQKPFRDIEELDEEFIKAMEAHENLIPHGTIQAHDRAMEVLTKDLLDEGKYADLTVALATDFSADLLTNFLLMKQIMGGVPGRYIPKGTGWIKEALKPGLYHAGRLGLFRWLFTPGDVNERTKAAGLASLYMMTYPFSSKLGGLAEGKAAQKGLSVFTDFLMNAGITKFISDKHAEAIKFGYDKAETEGSEYGFLYSAINLAKTYGSDLFFSLLTKPYKPANVSKEATEQILNVHKDLLDDVLAGKKMQYTMDDVVKEVNKLRAAEAVELKEVPSAVQERKTAEVPIRKEAEVGKEVGKEVRVEGEKVPTKAEKVEKPEFKKPSAVALFTPQNLYSKILGTGELTKPLEEARIGRDVFVHQTESGIDAQIKKIEKLGKVTIPEKIASKLKAKPTKPVEYMRDLLDKYQDVPKELDPAQKEVFNWFRDLTETTLEAENVVRSKLGMEKIPHRQAYVRHVAEGMAKDIIEGKIDPPTEVTFKEQDFSGKKFNPMEKQRALESELEDLYTKDLGYAMKSMVRIAADEIYLTEPRQALKHQLGLIDKPIEKIPAEERQAAEWLKEMPKDTRTWLDNYVKQVLTKEEVPDVDKMLNNIVTESGIKGVIDYALKPFGRTTGARPLTNLAQKAGRAVIHGVMGWRPKQLIRNKFQLLQNLAMCDVKSCLKALTPPSEQLKSLLNESSYIKSYTGLEELPVDAMGKLEKAWLAPYQWTAKTNATNAMKAAYWDRLDLIENPKYKDFGWADPKRTYKEKPEFLYPSEKQKIIESMELAAQATQFQYIPLGMPQAFRYKTLTPITRLSSWWMNYFLNFNRQAAKIFFTGQDYAGNTYPMSRRIGWLRYLALGGFILHNMDYERSYMFGVAPDALPPIAKLMTGMYQYIFSDKDWEKEKAERDMYESAKLFIPGYLAVKDFKELLSGKKQLHEYFFYFKGDKKTPEEKTIKEKPI